MRPMSFKTIFHESSSAKIFILDPHGLHFSHLSLYVFLICSIAHKIIQISYRCISHGTSTLKIKVDGTPTKMDLFKTYPQAEAANHDLFLEIWN